ncbi:MAG: TIGR03545 family protein, partial [Deltaproteobacteria bacterium]
MKRWIRWQGFIPFVCIVGLMLVFWYVFLDRIVERVIESAGTRMVGAKVEMDKADVSLFPLGLAIQRLQVTNPDSPMTNAVDIAAMKLSLDSGAL